MRAGKKDKVCLPGITPFFSFRFLRAKNHKLPNIGIAMSMLAVSISIAILIIVTSVMNGFRDELIDKILGFNSHITVHSKQMKFVNYKEVKENIMKIDGVVSASPVVNGAGMVSNGSRSAGIFVKGISLKELKQRKDLFKYIKGGMEEFKGLNIILGGDVANQLRARIGDEITMIVPIVATTMFGVVPRAVNMRVVGLLRTNAQQYDNYMAIVPFKAGQAIFNLQDQASAIEVMTRNPNDINGVELDILKVNEDKNVRLVDWYMENSALLNALNVEANVMALILSLFTIISMFTIFAIIRMMITSKEREIAILKSHGISNKQIRNIFLVVGMVVAVSGMVLGNVIGIAVSLNIDNIRVAIEKLFGTKLLDGSVYFLANLPSRLMLADIIKTNIFALVMAFACTLISSRKSTKIDITATLRNN